MDRYQERRGYDYNIRLFRENEMSKLNRYKLEVPGGSYEHSNLTLLIFAVLKHRFMHLIKEGKWQD